MKKEILPLVMMTLLVAVAFAPTAEAYPSMNVYGYTDRPYYMPGESGTLKFWIYNDGTDDLILKNITVYYPWYNPFLGGNETIKPASDTVIPSKGNWSGTLSFTVPDDGRAIPKSDFDGGDISLFVVTDKINYDWHLPLHVNSVPNYAAFENMNQLVTLFTILVVLVIVCTIIIAATIFLSAHRPQVMWKTEEKG